MKLMLNIKSDLISTLTIAIASLFLVSCEPEVDDKIDLGAPPVASFEIIGTDDPNTFDFRSTTTGAFLHQWDTGVGISVGEETQAYYPLAGTYEVTYTAFANGGSDSETQEVVVTTDAELPPLECEGNVELLTGCGTKVWKLAQEESALHVGPSLDEYWWGNSEADLGERECHFNDEYIFSIDGVYEYDNKGDFWADSQDDAVFPPDLGLDIGCATSSDWPDAYKAWDSGVHSFSVEGNKLTLLGNGAWLGLYKVGTGAIVSTPQQSVTLDISEISENRMVVYSDYGDGVWRFTLTSE